MAMVRARRWKDPGSERPVDGDPSSFAADECVALFEMNVGDVVFVQVEQDTFNSQDGWAIYRVECVDRSAHSYTTTTGEVSYEDAERELREPA